MNTPNAVVIGGGQAGLATAHVLRTRGLRPVVLEAGPEPVGSWPHYCDSLTLFSPARYSALPGLAFDGDPHRYPHRDEVVAYLQRYAAHLDAEIRTGEQVTNVAHRDGRFQVTTGTGAQFEAPMVIAATGGFSRPYRPELPGLADFTGTLLHSSDYRVPGPLAGQRVVVVGAGNSAVLVAVELATHADVTLATRGRIRFVRQRLFGRDVHFWTTITGLDALPVGPWLATPPGSPVFDHGRFRAALARRQPYQRPMFSRVDGTTVTWSDGSREDIDAIILATGYRPALDYLAPLRTVTPSGRPLHRAGASSTHLGLGYVGLGWQRGLASATLRGVGRDAAYLVSRLLSRLPALTRMSRPRTGARSAGLTGTPSPEGAGTSP
ncbi:flavin-containing monooxygenase [Allokutzneria albata]|uniref:Putative flavoprotein involved in K+ transport n=1 Tax=Allokutzneria albata TaxID=211114 RepID=A0A1G9SFR9_ALLAB|nr:NAD(P)-binding domain-containing protein [Allokutzneria albata]SDM34252.1 putative flavoprotein involved in K+ transport [Allokutzneria albata]